MTKRCLLAAALLLCFHSASGTELGAVVVTATRTAQTVDQTLSSTTVVTRSDIERRQAHSVQDLLRGVAGISTASNGGRGKATSLYLRGTEADHVLVMIDGIKVGSATLGTTAFQDIPVAQIDRIEIVRGPRSSLYGSEAIGGVIQLFTRKGGGPAAPRFSISGGSDRTVEASAGVSGGGERGWFDLGISGIDTSGFNACDGPPSPGGAGCFTTEPDRDGYHARSLTARAGFRFSDRLSLDLRALHTHSRNRFDGSAVNESDARQQVLGGTLRYAPLDRWQITLTAGRSRDRSDNAKDGRFGSRFDTERRSFSLQNDIAVAADHLLTVGADHQDDRVGGTTAYAVDSRDDTGLFAQYQGAIGVHDVQLSLRRDDNQQFGDRVTGGAAWGFALNPDTRMRAAFGTAFKAPTFNELYFPGFGNPHLRPETSRSLEVGLEGRTAGARWSLEAYESRIDQLIAFDASRFAPANIAEARIRGLEAGLATRVADWALDASLTLLDLENRSGGANDGHVLPRRPRQSLQFDADRRLGRYDVGASLFAAGSRYDDLANRRELGGYALLDLRLTIALAPGWRLQARAENVFDKDYETAAFFNPPGRSLALTLRYQPS